MCQSVWLTQNICTNSKGMTFNVFRVVFYWTNGFSRKGMCNTCETNILQKKNKEMRYRDSWQAEKNGTRFEFTDTISGKGNWKNSAMLFWVFTCFRQYFCCNRSDLFQDENRIRRLWAITKWCDDDSHAVPLLITRSSTPLCQRTSSPPSSKHQMVEEWTINVKMHWWSASGMLWLNI